MPSAHGYTYPNVSDNPDQTNVLRNRLGLHRHSELHPEEYRRTSHRILEIRMGLGPTGHFDVDHLKAIHRHIFQDVYEWAGHMRHERPIVDGAPVEVIGSMRKGTTSFLPGSHIDQGLSEAFRPIRNPDVLKGASVDRFSEIAGKVLNELNYVHPFREGNGRAQEAFIAELGRHYGHNVDLSVITRTRMIGASIAGTQDPDHPAMAALLRDATDPARSGALKGLMRDLSSDPGARSLDTLSIRTANPGETVEGQFRARTDRCGAFETATGIVAIPVADMRRARRHGDGYAVRVLSDFEESPARPRPKAVVFSPASAPVAFGPDDAKHEGKLVAQALEDGRKAASCLHAFWSAPPSLVCRDIERAIREEGGDPERAFQGMKAGGPHAALGERITRELREHDTFGRDLKQVQDGMAAYGRSRAEACAFGAAHGREREVLDALSDTDREIGRHACRTPTTQRGQSLLQTLSGQPSLTMTPTPGHAPSPSSAPTAGPG